MSDGPHSKPADWWSGLLYKDLNSYATCFGGELGISVNNRSPMHCFCHFPQCHSRLGWLTTSCLGHLLACTTSLWVLAKHCAIRCPMFDRGQISRNDAATTFHCVMTSWRRPWCVMTTSMMRHDAVISLDYPQHECNQSINCSAVSLRGHRLLASSTTFILFWAC